MLRHALYSRWTSHTPFLRQSLGWYFGGRAPAPAFTLWAFFEKQLILVLTMSQVERKFCQSLFDSDEIASETDHCEEAQIKLSKGQK